MFNQIDDGFRRQVSYSLIFDNYIIFKLQLGLIIYSIPGIYIWFLIAFPFLPYYNKNNYTKLRLKVTNSIKHELPFFKKCILVKVISIDHNPLFAKPQEKPHEKPREKAEMCQEKLAWAGNPWNQTEGI